MNVKISDRQCCIVAAKILRNWIPFAVEWCEISLTERVGGRVPVLVCERDIEQWREREIEKGLERKTRCAYISLHANSTHKAAQSRRHFNYPVVDCTLSTYSWYGPTICTTYRHLHPFPTHLLGQPASPDSYKHFSSVDRTHMTWPRFTSE